ncbi:urea carboxylase-associated family protein [Paracoccus sp. MBLB3053]|uniref:Urea carboxylase-associated family protein n=1 Tax=Paracoccus aurantius TaxID=3073814 RepID=A0ABU2HVW9_9RHOB|nr:urea carboxylase-associated family protein [Paracoccus sp. MBLB3053]MDS9469176.1 urea carboxylase-associated family protein [Paracoccus sp. MBLB3053]
MTSFDRIDEAIVARALAQEPGSRLRTQIIPPQGRVAVELEKGQTLRVVDLDGQQVADLICFNRDDLAEKFSPNVSVMLKGNIHLTTGDYLYSVDARPLLRIGHDTVGCHDVLAGSCCRGLNRFRYGPEAEHQPNCRDNLAAVMAPYGVTIREIPYPFNVFMNVPVEADGHIEVIEPVSKPGDFVDLIAERNVVVAISNCPQERNECNGFAATRLGLVIYAAEASA